MDTTKTNLTTTFILNNTLAGQYLTTTKIYNN